MMACAARHSRCHLQAKTAVGGSIVTPGRHQEESLANQQRWPRVSRNLGPVNGVFAPQLWRVAGEVANEHFLVGAIIEECAQTAGLFYNPGCAGLP